jgi:hypothetical protein
MRCILCTDKPNEITFRLTMVATAKEFEQLRDQLDQTSGHPASELKYALNDVLSQARKVFWGKENQSAMRGT